MQNRGQFYLVAVIIILALVASVATVYNYTITKKSEKFVYELSKEIEFEASKVLDRGVFQEESENEITSQIKTLTDYYARTNPQTDLIIVYGSEQNVHFLYYNQTTSGNIGLEFGYEVATLPVPDTSFQSSSVPRSSDPITINIAEGISYTYALRKGQFVFVVLKSEKDGERYIEVPE